MNDFKQAGFINFVAAPIIPLCRYIVMGKCYVSAPCPSVLLLPPTRPRLFDSPRATAPPGRGSSSAHHARPPGQQEDRRAEPRRCRYWLWSVHQTTHSTVDCDPLGGESYSS